MGKLLCSLSFGVHLVGRLESMVVDSLYRPSDSVSLGGSCVPSPPWPDSQPSTWWETPAPSPAPASSPTWYSWDPFVTTHGGQEFYDTRRELPGHSVFVTNPPAGISPVAPAAPSDVSYDAHAAFQDTDTGVTVRPDDIEEVWHDVETGWRWSDYSGWHYEEQGLIFYDCVE